MIPKPVWQGLKYQFKNWMQKIGLTVYCVPVHTLSRYAFIIYYVSGLYSQMRHVVWNAHIQNLQETYVSLNLQKIF